MRSKYAFSEATMKSDVNAILMWDGGEVTVPPEMCVKGIGKGQLAGTRLENLCELACRICYDSLGKGRTSVELHRHILEVGHLSVYEHGVFTVEIDGGDDPTYWRPFLNRKGVWLDVRDGKLRITLNLRTVLDWQKHYCRMNSGGAHTGIHQALLYHASTIAPMVVQPPKPGWSEHWCRTKTRITDPIEQQECWLTLLLCGSRGMSHEQVRHGDDTAISQRSTRFVDEAGSQYVMHPLLKRFLETAPKHEAQEVQMAYDLAVEASRTAYRRICDGLTKHTASGIKQTRGAARGVLGNALYTEIVFSASASQWRWMTGMRYHDAADAEIRKMYSGVLTQLQSSRHSAYFNDMTHADASDGLGTRLDYVGGGR